MMTFTSQYPGKLFELSALIILLLLVCCLPAAAQDKYDEEPPKPCPKPYIKTISPQGSVPLTEVKIRGSRLGNQPGAVTFTPGENAKIVSWTNKRIFVEIPEKAQTGPVTVTSQCGSVSNTQHFTVEKKVEEEY